MIIPDSFEHKIGFDTLRQWLKQRCVTPLGAQWCDDMTFSDDAPTVARKLGATAEMLAVISSEAETFPLADISDMTAQLQAIRVAGSFIPAAELLPMLRTLQVMAALRDFFCAHRHDDGEGRPVRLDYPCLDEIACRLEAFPQIVAMIERLIDRFGNVKDSASPELREIRRQLAQTSGAISSTMRRVLAQAAAAGYVDADTAPSMRDGRLVIPVAPMHKRRISGIVHDESASGKTVYIEPAEIVEANNRVRELQMEERREIVRLLTLLAADMRPHVPAMLDSMAIVGELDFIHAKAVFASETGGHMPVVETHPEMEWYHAVHPVLLLTLRRQGKEVVPLDITLTPERRILIISGPNAGGKSVCLKTVGIIQYMAQCGMLPPMYENSHLGVFSDIMVDIGDDQSIEDDLSTYSSHLRSMKRFMQHGGGATLALIDEFGGGTEPQIGGAIAQAVLRRFNDQGMWGVITTHYQNLKHFADETPGLVNGSMLYDRQKMQPMFMLSIGSPGSSFALEIARKTGLPDDVIADAQQIVGSDYINMDKYLLDIARDRRYWENKRMAIRQKEKKVESRLAQYEEDAEQLRMRRREILDDARRQAREILDSSNATIERTIHDIRRTQADREATLEARRRLSQEKEQILSGADSEHSLLRKAPKKKAPRQQPQPAGAQEPVAVGDNVKLDGQDTVGRVMAVEGKQATVAFGQITTRVPLSRLKRTVAKAPSGARPGATLVGAATSDAQRQRQLDFSQEIDLRGMRVDEAVQALTYYIDDAIRFNAKRVRILHGTGTGALRQYLRQYLDTVPGVASYRDEHVQFGGAGITVVDLE